jgi:hypothetical protein
VDLSRAQGHVLFSFRRKRQESLSEAQVSAHTCVFHRVSLKQKKLSMIINEAVVHIEKG